MNDAFKTDPLPSLLVLAFAVFVWLVFQTYSLFNERQGLLAAGEQLAAQAEAATKVRTSLDKIATGVKRLAEGGNANAAVVVEQLARRGVTINPNSIPAGGDKK